MNFDACVELLNQKLSGELFFLEIGAMDGVAHDALHKHIMANPEWSGLLVEPLPDMFAKLKENYKGTSNLAFEQAAITNRNGTALITRIPYEYANKECPDWADGIATLKPETHIISRYPHLKPYAVKEEVATMTFKLLAKKHKIRHIDVLQIDTEGSDKEIFDQVWDQGFRPSLIKLEVLHITYMQILELNTLLSSNGYVCSLEAEDIVAFQQPV